MRADLVSVLFFAFVSISTVVAVTTRTVANGFSWAENLRCDPVTQSLFVTELTRAELWKVEYENGSFNQSIHVSGDFDKFDGVAVHPTTGALYVLARKTGSAGSSVIRVDTKVPQSYTVVAQLPKLGNGLAYDLKRNVLYATVEGLFVPLEGLVYAIDLNNGGAVSEVPAFKYGWSDDGAYVDQAHRLLYVSEVLLNKVFVYDLDQQSMNRTFKAQTDFLDDFTLSADGHYMYGASFGSGQVKVIDVESGEASVLVSGLTNPTSARWGCGGGFPETSLFVTEGGSFSKSTTDRKVVEVLGARSSCTSGC